MTLGLCTMCHRNVRNRDSRAGLCDYCLTMAPILREQRKQRAIRARVRRKRRRGFQP